MRFIVHEEEREYEFLLSPGLYIVGRDPTCDLTLDSKRVSRRHMSCTVTENTAKIKDLGSRNCVKMNGQKTKEATLEDGDELSLGDVRLVFRDRGGAAAAAGPAVEAEAIEEAEEGPPTAHATVEDSEETPPEGALVRREDVAPNAQVVQRDGHWYVTEPETGREVEIVPAEEAEKEEKKSLLATAKGRMIVGGLAAGVVLLFLLAAVFSGGEEPTRPTLSARQFEQLLGETLDSLDRGETDRAQKLAQHAREARPDSETAEILVELTGLWDEWQASFFDHWLEVKRLLGELYSHYDSRKVETFVRNYRDWINKELRYSEMANNAREAYRQGDYEQAWQLLQDVPRGSPVRERDAGLFEQVRTNLRQRLQDRMQSAATRQDWVEARKQAETLLRYYPDARKSVESKLQQYSRYVRHAESVRLARQAIQEERYTAAVDELKDVPAGSPYQAEAERLRQRAAARGKFKQATRLYNEGQAEEAMRMLGELSAGGAGALRRHIETVKETYEAAQQAQQENQLAEAQEQWERLMELESDEQNHYRRAARQALNGMEERRRELARRLVAQVGELYRQEQYEKCRQLAERAVLLDPDGEIGADHLRQLQHQGRMDYRRAINLTEKAPKEALHLFTRATKLLSPDDKYYTWALDEKRKLERELDE